MLAHVRVHPLLVTATKEKELLRERLVVDVLSCALYFNCLGCLQCFDAVGWAAGRASCL